MQVIDKLKIRNQKSMQILCGAVYWLLFQWKMTKEESSDQ